MRRKVPEAEAWREVAADLVNERYVGGLCIAILAARFEPPVHYRMMARMEGHRRDFDPERWKGYYVYHDGGENYEARALACLWMALEAEEETRAAP